MNLGVLLLARKARVSILEIEHSWHTIVKDTQEKLMLEFIGGSKMTKINNRMKVWIEQAIVDVPEPFTAKEIHGIILDNRKNTNYVSSPWSVAYYLNQICVKKRIGKANRYWRKTDED